MTFALPQPVAAYFEADEKDGEAVSKCFTESAIVKDEGHTYHGRNAIKRWKDEAAAKYQYISEILGAEQADDDIVVPCRLTGNFPGSPVVLQFRFKLEGDKIASLDVAP